MIQINRYRVESLLRSQNGGFLTVSFIKKDGSLRTLNGRLGVVKGVRGTGRAQSPALPYITVFDVQIGEFRKVNLSTIRTINCGKQTYRVV